MLWLWLSLSAASAYADAVPEPIRIDNRSVEIELHRHWLVYQDDDSKLSLDEVRQASLSWQPNGEQVPSFGFSGATIWFYTQLHNDAFQERSLFLDITYPLLDYVELFLVQDDELLVHQVEGDRVLLPTKTHPHRHLLFPLRLQPQQSYQLYLRLKSSSALQLPAMLYDEERFFWHDQWGLLIQGLYFGAILVMIVYNFLLLMMQWERSYLFYILYAACYLLFQATLQGISLQFLPLPHLLIDYGTLIPGLLAIGFAALFAHSFLQANRYSHVYSMMLQAIPLIALVAILSVSFASYSALLKVMLVLAIVCSMMILGLGFRLWQQGDTSARLFTLAWLTMLVAFISASLNRFGLLPRNFITEDLMQIGGIIEIVMLSLALAEKIHYQRRLRLQDQQQDLSQQQDLNRLLEGLVAERTSDLSKTLDELNAANRRLQVMSHTDELTQVKNRRSFDRELANELRVAQREGAPFALCLIDVDHFKQLNDQYGHLAGDKVLRRLAQELKEQLRRPRDELFRYGGEEFAVILPLTGEEEAKMIAERMRSSIENSEMRGCGIDRPVTVSIGISCYRNRPVVRLESMVRQADIALYEAKRCGRNRVKLV